jgi:hypothetical protein
MFWGVSMTCGQECAQRATHPICTHPNLSAHFPHSFTKGKLEQLTSFTLDVQFDIICGPWRQVPATTTTHADTASHFHVPLT